MFLREVDAMLGRGGLFVVPDDPFERLLLLLLFLLGFPVIMGRR